MPKKYESAQEKFKRENTAALKYGRDSKKKKAAAKTKKTPFSARAVKSTIRKGQARRRDAIRKAGG